MTAKTLEPLHWPISESSTVKDAYHDGKEDARSYSGDSSYFPEELNVVKAQRIVPAKGEKNWIPVSNLAPSSGQAWSIQDSDCLYGLSQWSEGYFGVNESGNIIVRPNGGKKQICLCLHQRWNASNSGTPRITQPRAFFAYTYAGAIHPTTCRCRRGYRFA
jgi:hypothetical protein